MAFTIHVDRSSLAKSANGPVTGIVFIELDGLAFPERGWNDFAVVILSWWLEALGRVPGSTAPQVCSFMDGPFQFEVQGESANTWTLRLVDRRRPAASIEAQVPAREVTAAVANAAEVVLEHCQRHDWKSRDIETLAANHSRLAAGA